MVYEITEQDFLALVPNPSWSCDGNEIKDGKAKDGHSNCKNGCRGNYFVGGECNWGGGHKLKRDLYIINQNFREFNKLSKQQNIISGSQTESEFNKNKKTLLESFRKLKQKCQSCDEKDFFLGSCIGIEDSYQDFLKVIKDTLVVLADELQFYVEETEKSTWEQLKNFREKMETLKKMTSEYNNLAKEWENETNPEKKQQLWLMLAAKEKELTNLEAEMKNHPAYNVFSKERNAELANLVKNIFYGKRNFFSWRKQKEKDDEKKQEKYLGLVPKKWGKKILLVGGIGIILLVCIYLFRRFVKK